MTRFAVLGLGEAGGAIAADLAAAGIEVHGYDPGEVATPRGVVREPDPRAAVAGAAVVLAVTAGAHAAGALDQVADAVPDGALYADLSTGSPRLKRELALRLTRTGTGAGPGGGGGGERGRGADRGLRFADVALMAPVPGRGVRVPALVSGPGAQAFVAAMRPLGMAVEHAGDEPGQAATRKLLRSVVTKGLAQLLIESLAAADAAGLHDETWGNLVAQLGAVDEALIRRLVVDTPRHAPRRLEEMEATVELLEELGVDATMSRATAARLRTLNWRC